MPLREVRIEGAERFTAERLKSPIGSCAVELLKDEPMFIISFGLMNGITLNVSHRDAALTSIAATKGFPIQTKQRNG